MMMTMKTQDLYHEALTSPRTTKLNVLNQTHIFYKGFKFVKKNDEIALYDTRCNDFYRRVDPLPLMIEKGFLRACDLIMYEKDKERVVALTRKLERLYTAKKEFVKKAIDKKLRLCEENIAETIDLLFFYKSRVQQFKPI